MKKIVFEIFLVLAATLFTCSVFLSLFIHFSLPTDDGEITTPLVDARVTVTKDQWGIPHIKAGNEHDAMFAYGYTVAKDRVFQMDLQRRLARGELAEILGEDLVAIDKMFRTYMLAQWGKEYLADTNKINPSTLKYVDAFISGINHYVNTGPKPVEYYLLGEEIRPFDRLDVASMTVYMAFSLMEGIKRDAFFSMLKAKVKPKDLAILFPDYGDNNYLTIMEEEVKEIPKRNYTDSAISLNSETSLPQNYIDLIAYFDLSKKANQIIPPFHGSNSWVLAPSRSKDGNAILANDPHIGISKPDVWYEAHISYPGYNNYGYYVPTIPFPLIGHDDFKAWGMTMFENDEVDLYAETINPTDSNQVSYKGKWENINTIDQTIKVKNKTEEKFAINVTSHGPIISDFIKNYSGKPLAFSWVFYQIENPIFDLLYDISHAKSMEEFRAPLTRIASPGLNFSYVDKKGNIAWWATGKIPVRDSSVYAKEILDGSDSINEITSYVPFDENPHLINPESGVIITANNLSTKNRVGNIPRLDGYFRSTDRAGRILELLKSKEKWSTKDLMKVQTDNQLRPGMKMNNAIVEELLNENEEWDILQKNSLEILKSWDGEMGTESIGATIFQFTTYHILKELLQEKLNEEEIKLYLNMIDHWEFLKNLLYKKQIPFYGEDQFHGKIVSGYKNALAELVQKHGNSTANWKWGNIHKIEFEHPIGKKKPLNYLLNLGPYPAPAGFNVVNKIMSNIGDHNYKATSLPSTRRLINIGDPDQSYSILPSGNSGNFQSPHYNDQVEMFLNGEYRNLLFTDQQLNNNKQHTMLILPE